jgi:hypothetical protein
MTNQFDPERDNRPRPFGTVDDLGEDATTDPDDGEARLPRHEIDENETVGGGILTQGGTAIDRGTGTLGGQAQGDDDRNDDKTAGTTD